MVHWGTLDFQFAPMSLLQIDMLCIYLYSDGSLVVCIGFTNAGLLVHLVHWFTWCIGSPGALVHLVQVHLFTGALVHLVHWYTGSPVHCGSLVHRCTGSLVLWCTGSLVHWFTGALVVVHWVHQCWFTGSPGALVHLVQVHCMVHWCTGSPGAPVHWFTGSPVHQFTGSPVHWCSGALVLWCTGSLVHWCTGAPVHWFTGSPGAPVHWCTGALVHLLVPWFTAF